MAETHTSEKEQSVLDKSRIKHLEAEYVKLAKQNKHIDKLIWRNNRVFHMLIHVIRNENLSDEAMKNLCLITNYITLDKDNL